MPVVVRSSPEDTTGVIPVAVDESTGRPRAVMPVAVKNRKTVRKRAAVIPVAVKNLSKSAGSLKPSRRRPEAENPVTIRAAIIGIADELIEAEKSIFRLAFHYLRAMTDRTSSTLAGGEPIALRGASEYNIVNMGTAEVPREAFAQVA
ncbi:MAG TPA: hypothetical protein VF786_08335 [Terriglobales bacterium]